jgi:hypothetical protein
MSNYVKATDFAAKDTLTTGNPLKLIKGTEINDELNAIQTAVATKADLASPAFTGNPTAATQASGNSTSRLATTAFVQQEIIANEASVAITGGTIANVAITGGTLSGLTTDLAVADGGTGASTLAANAVLLGNGTSAIQTVAPSTSGNVLTSNGTTWTSAIPASVGIGQTWQDVTGSRVKNTTYTNSTGKPIMVNVFVSSSDTGGDVNLVVGGVTIARVNNYTPETGMTLSGIVPNSTTYSISNDFSFWVELR